MPGQVSGSVRAPNRAEVLQLILNGDDTMTRAEIARVTGLTSATVSAIVNDLVQDGIVAFGPTAESTGGKPPRTLAVRTDRRCAGVVMPRPTTIGCAVVDLTGRTVATDQWPRTPGPIDPQAIADAVRHTTGLTELDPIGVAVRVPGTVQGLVVHESAQLGLDHVDLQPALAAAVDVPVLLVNDADADAWNEYDPDDTGNRSQLLVWIGRGLGSAMILDGRLRRGETSRAGEIGHVRVDHSSQAPPCRCGARGCLELSVSLPHIFDIPEATDLADVDLETSIGPAAAERLARSHRYLARTLVTLCAATDVSSVVVGGPAARLGEAYLGPLRAEVARLRAYGTAEVRVRLAHTGVGEERGGAAAVLHELFGVHWRAAMPDAAAAR